VLIVGLIVGAWTVRNYLQFSEVITIATNGGYNFWQTNQPYADGNDTYWPFVPMDDPEYQTMRYGDEFTKNREGYRYAFAYLRANPGHLLTMLPAKLFWADDSQTNDKALLPQVLKWLGAGTLLVFDLGYFAFTFFDDLTAQLCFFVTRLREKTSYQVLQSLVNRPHVRDQVLQLGLYRANPCVHRVRLIEVYVNGAWRRYLTNVCQRCAIKHRCTTAKERRITRWEHEHILEAVQRRRLAERLGEPLVTIDDRLRRRLAHLGLVLRPDEAL